ncbi:MAG: benzil reductase ((S)-benzoin forming) [bacterium]|jgi:benzil reductase ((S)-benzoin forming)
METDSFFITGTSRGIGQALAKTVIKNQHYTIGISRGESSDELDQHIQFDLSEVDQIESILDEIVIPDSGKFWLVNNAAVLEPIQQIGNFKASDIDWHIRVNLTAPLIIINYLIKKIGIDRLGVLNISSGAASSPYSGWGMYCTGKAGLEMFSKVLWTEYPELTVYSLAPGVIDTEMQQIIRGKTEGEFPLKEKFVQLHENQELADPIHVAEQIYSFLYQNQNSGCYDLRTQ